jgi:predicted transcriptional regulator
MTEINPAELLPLVTNIIAAHVGSNKIAPAEVPQLIRQVYQALAQASAGETGSIARGDPAVPIKKSVTPDFIVCLEDGEKLKMLKRHLRTAHDMSLDQYRQRWGLPADYPMIAPNYAKARSKLAKQIGLGRKPRAKKAQPLSSKRSTRSKRSARKRIARS